MFSKFKLNDIAYSDFEKYESEGKRENSLTVDI